MRLASHRSGRIPDQGSTVLVAARYQPSNLVRLPLRSAGSFAASGKEYQHSIPSLSSISEHAFSAEINPQARDPLYLFSCQLNWEKGNDPTGAWEVISAANSSHPDTRAYARSLLERLLEIDANASEQKSRNRSCQQKPKTEGRMRTPYGLDIIESCVGCKASRDSFFCRFSQQPLRSLDEVSHHTVMPGGAVLFVEGQKPRGVFILCSGSVRLSTISKEGKMLVLKQATAGEVLGLSAAFSGTNYEVTAETVTTCQLNFIGRQDLVNLLHSENEMGVQSAVWLSREFQGVYRDIHGLVLARSSLGKLARLLLSSCAPPGSPPSKELPAGTDMTHEEMAQRIGTSRETVTRWLTELKKKKLIRSDGDTLVIRDYAGLESMIV
jgi:CRP/FNR family transcriptional regulator, cyclic AMP receptor protein